MSTAAIPIEQKPILSAEARYVSAGRRRGMGITLILISLVMLFTFGLGVSSHDETSFILNSGTATSVSPINFPVRHVSIALAIVCALVGVVLIVRRLERGTYALFGLGIALFLWSFLAWSARDNSLNITGVISTTLVSAIPIVFGSLSGVMCERSGVINIAIEGQFLIGAFLAAMVASATGDLWLGLFSGAVGGAILGALLAFFAIRYSADQIIVGVVIGAFATGLTNYLTETVLVPHQNLNTGPVFSQWGIPLLDKIPVLGPVLFDQNVFVYLAAVFVVAIQTGLFRTRWG
ncbi:MAG: hypothetical protein WB770_11850, partial [Acidimicrobiales bacterium]